MTLAVGDAEIAVVWEMAGDAEPMINVLGWNLSRTEAYFLPAALEEYRLAIESAVVPEMTTQFTLLELRATFQTAGGPRHMTAVSGEVGAVSAGVLPPNTAHLVHKITSGVGRGSRGRLYLPGVPEAFCGDSGTLTSPRRSAITEAWQSVVDFGQTTDGPLCVNHSVTDVNPEPDMGDDIDSMVCDPRVATQRRRLRR